MLPREVPGFMGWGEATFTNSTPSSSSSKSHCPGSPSQQAVAKGCRSHRPPTPQHGGARQPWHRSPPLGWFGHLSAQKSPFLGSHGVRRAEGTEGEFPSLLLPREEQQGAPCKGDCKQVPCPAASSWGGGCTQGLTANCRSLGRHQPGCSRCWPKAPKPNARVALSPELLAQHQHGWAPGYLGRSVPPPPSSLIPNPCHPQAKSGSLLSTHTPRLVRS